MHIQVNGEPREIAEGSSVSDLLRELELQADRVAVEINLKILDRGEFEGYRLQADDHIEILSFIGGGSSPGFTETGNQLCPSHDTLFVTERDQAPNKD